MELFRKIIVICAPSGSGKTSISKKVMESFPVLSFSVSATTRDPRGLEQDGIDYYFLSPQDFKEKLSRNEFAEWEEVYADKFYGTLKSEIDRLHEDKRVPILDIDVKGAQSIKKIYGEEALVIFIKAPLEEIKKRLSERGTETPEQIQMRLNRVMEELTYEDKCDVTVENIDLEKAVEDCKNIINNFLSA